MVRLPFMVRRLAIARHLAIARQMSTAVRRPTVLLQLTARHPAMTRQMTMGHQLITVRRHGRRMEFRMPFLRYAQRVIFNGDAVPAAAGRGGCAIPRRLRRGTMPRHIAAFPLSAKVLPPG